MNRNSISLLLLVAFTVFVGLPNVFVGLIESNSSNPIPNTSITTSISNNPVYTPHINSTTISTSTTTTISTTSTETTTTIIYNSMGIWAGYSLGIQSNVMTPEEIPQGNITSIWGSWVVDNVSKYNGLSILQWIGIGGTVETNPLIQVGTTSIKYRSGQGSSYYTWFETIPGYNFFPTPTQYLQPGFSVSPGDVMSASITKVGTNLWTYKITDLTSSTSSSFTVSFNDKGIANPADFVLETQQQGMYVSVPITLNYTPNGFYNIGVIANGTSKNFCSPNVLIIKSSINYSKTLIGATGGTLQCNSFNMWGLDE